MTNAICKKSGKKHTPIVSEKQRGLFGAELARRKAGKTSRMGSITTEELRSHLQESKGKNLPESSNALRNAVMGSSKAVEKVAKTRMKKKKGK